MNNCSHGLALQYLPEIARGIHIENQDGQFVLPAHGKGGQVHDFEPSAVSILKSEVLEFYRSRDRKSVV